MIQRWVPWLCIQLAFFLVLIFLVSLIFVSKGLLGRRTTSGAVCRRPQGTNALDYAVKRSFCFASSIGIGVWTGIAADRLNFGVAGGRARVLHVVHDAGFIRPKFSRSAEIARRFWRHRAEMVTRSREFR
jgi:hypothetical protein